MSEAIPGDNAGAPELQNAATPVPQSEAAQVADAAGASVHATGDSLSKAGDSLSKLASGDANIVDAAVAVKGAIDSVQQLSGKISEAVMMPVMKALSAFKGVATLPAGKQMDPVMGIDVHMVTIPPSPAPIPLPHPYIGMLFNPKDWVSCVINTFKPDILAAVPAPAEGEKGIGASLAANKEAIMGIAMGVAGMSASVKFGGFTPRAVTGTKTKNIPHIPFGAGWFPAFAASVAKNHGKAFLGSLFVVADGDPMVGSFHLNYDCWDVGIIDLFKGQRAGEKKKPEPGAPLAELYVPSGTVLPIPMGKPVLVNSIPTPINPLSIVDKLFKAGLSKLKAAGRKAVQKQLDKLTGKVGCKKLTAVSKLIGTGQSHPVDVAEGHFYTDNVDFNLPGPIPISFERTWYSYSDYKGPLGIGWHHSYDLALAIDNETQKAVLRLADGRVTLFDIPSIGKEFYNRGEKITLHIHEDGYYFFTDKKGLIYRFAQTLTKNPFNNTETYLLQSIANRNGFAIRFAYDKNGSLTQITDSASRILTVNNDKEGRIINIQAPDPRFQGRTSFAITSFAYTPEGDMSMQADALDQAIRYEYENHLMVKEIWRNGLKWNFKYNKSSGTDAKCIEASGDGDMLHYKFDYTDPECTFVTNSLGHKKTFYHKDGVVIKYVDPNGAAWEYRYNNFSEIEWETDPLGNQQSFTYDKWGNMDTGTNPAGGFHQTSYITPGFPSLPNETIDTVGGKWKWEYDEKGNLTERVNPLGAKTRYEYDDGMPVKVINAAGAVTKLAFDNEQNLAFIRKDDGATSEFSYDVLGNCIGSTNHHGFRQKRTYDLKGRIIQVKNFDGNNVVLEYDGLDNLILYRDNQKEVKYTYRGHGTLTSRTEAGATTVFNYDTEGQLRNVINEEGLSYLFELDAAGRVVKEVGFDGLTRRYEYNAAGWVTQVLRPNGKFTKYYYDECGRVIEKLYSDDKKELFSYRADGLLIGAVNESATVQFERNAMGGVLKETVNDEWISSEFDVYGNKIKAASSLGANITREYNKMGDLMHMGVNGWLAKFEHNKSGLETALFLPGGIFNRWERDGLGRPILQTIGDSKNTSLPNRRQYKWDVNNRLKEIREENGVIRFEHDAWSNLTKTTFANGEEQLRNPDIAGNLFKSNDRKDRTYAHGGQLKKAGGWSYNYDEEGNLVEKKHTNGDTWKYEWNHAGRLASVVRPDKALVIFLYDALGRRISKQYKNTKTKFVWDGDVPLHEWKEHAVTGEKLGDTNVGESGIVTWLFDENNFAPAAKIKGDKQYTIISDHIGTPFKMYRSDGTLFWDCELDSYGKVRMEKGEIGSCPFRYRGQYEDAETGLCYNRFRYYSPDEGVYISQDPIRLEGKNPTMYSYVRDTTVRVDFFGLDETYYRTMSQKDAAEFERTGKVPATTETSISPTRSFSDGYDGVTYEITVKDGTTQALADVGVRDQSKLVSSKYPDMPEGGKGWNEDHARFKAEKLKATGKQQINIGLGKGTGLNVFNDNIVSFKRCV